MAEEKTLPCDGKLALDTQQQAKAAALVAEMQHGVKLTTYLCEHCGLWHLASS